MKPSVHISDINRRVLLSALAVLPLPALLHSRPALAQDTENLAWWNDGAAKQGIIDFVRATSERSNPARTRMSETAEFPRVRNASARFFHQRALHSRC